MLTADTVTDDQIRELRDSKDSMCSFVMVLGVRLSVYDTCERALRMWGNDPYQWRMNSRAICAEILNARAPRQG